MLRSRMDGANQALGAEELTDWTERFGTLIADYMLCDHSIT